MEHELDCDTKFHCKLVWEYINGLFKTLLHQFTVQKRVFKYDWANLFEIFSLFKIANIDFSYGIDKFLYVLLGYIGIPALLNRVTFVSFLANFAFMFRVRDHLIDLICSDVVIRVNVSDPAVHCWENFINEVMISRKLVYQAQIYRQLAARILFCQDRWRYIPQVGRENFRNDIKLKA